MKLFKEQAGVISEGSCWVFIDSAWLYINTSLLRLCWEVLTQWRHDKHLVG